MPRMLTKREATFARHIVAGKTARAAAIAVGVKPASAAQVGYRLVHRERVWCEVLQLREVEENHERLAVAEQKAHDKYGVTVVHVDGRGRTHDAVRKAVRNRPGLVRDAARAVGMLPVSVTAIELRNGKEVRVRRELYEPNADLVVRTARLMNSKLRAEIKRSFVRFDPRTEAARLLDEWRLQQVRDHRADKQRERRDLYVNRDARTSARPKSTASCTGTTGSEPVASAKESARPPNRTKVAAAANLHNAQRAAAASKGAAAASGSSAAEGIKACSPLKESAAPTPPRQGAGGKATAGAGASANGEAAAKAKRGAEPPTKAGEPVARIISVTVLPEGRVHRLRKRGVIIIR